MKLTKIIPLLLSGGQGDPVLATYLLQDDFAVDDAAPLDASTSVTGGKRVKAADTNNNASIVSGEMLLTGTSAVNYTNPAYYWTDAADAGFPVADGFAIAWNVRNTAANVNNGMSIGSHPDATIAGNVEYHWLHSAGGNLNVLNPALTTVATWTFGVQYRLVQAFNGNNILWYRYDGADWKLEYKAAITYPSVLYPTFTGVATSTNWKASHLRVANIATPGLFDTTMAINTTLDPVDNADLIEVLNQLTGNF